jgi:dynein heavy chain 2
LKSVGDNTDSPVVDFIILENHNAIQLVHSIHSSLSLLNRVLKGSSLLMPSTHLLAQSLLNHQVPSTWSSQWEGPEEPSAYLRTLIGKAMALGAWQEKAVRKTLIKEGSPLDLAEVFNPATFLNALRQETAR